MPEMQNAGSRREARQSAFAYAGAALLSLALIGRFAERRAPYFAPPATIVDHVGVREHATRDALLLIPQVEPLLPRGAEVTCFRPRNGQAWNDDVNYLTAVGLLERQSVLPPFTAGPELRGGEAVEWVIAVGAPFDHPSYEPVAGFPNGYLYHRK